MREKTRPAEENGKPYEAPTVTRISLRPEEAVLGHCKITGHAGPVSGNCHTPAACRSQGS